MIRVDAAWGDSSAYTGITADRCVESGAGVQVKSPGDPRNFEAERAKDDVDTSYKSTGLFADF